MVSISPPINRGLKAVVVESKIEDFFFFRPGLGFAFSIAWHFHFHQVMPNRANAAAKGPSFILIASRFLSFFFGGGGGRGREV